MRSITIEANLEEGTSLGAALSYLENLADKHLPSKAIIDYKGESRDYKISGGSIVFVFILGITVVFIFLSAQYESYINP